MLLGSNRSVRLNRNGARCQHNISELLRFCGSKDCGSSCVPSAGSLSPLLFALSRSDKVTLVYGPLTGPSGFGVRSLATKSSTSMASWKNRLPAPGAEFCPENAQIVVHRLLQRIDTVDSDEDKALVRWRGVRLEPSSTISNGIRLTMRLIRLLRSAVT